MSIYAINLLRQLVAAGHDVTMISQFYGDPDKRRVYGGGPPPAVPGVRVIGMEALGEQNGGDFERDVDAIVQAIAAEHATAPFDVLHAQYGYPTGWATLLAAQQLGLTCIVSIQGGDGHWVGSCCETHRTAMVRVLDHASALLIGGRSFAGEVHERLGTPVDRFTIVPGAVDTDRFTPGHAREPGAPVRFFYHGRVDRRKGVLDMLQALPDVAGAWRCTISGIGPDLEPARALATELGLDDRVSFTGYADYDAVPALYRDHDVFVSPTYAEGFSNTILEAMASRHAVLSCRSVGVVDCIRDGENGILVEAGDVPALSRALSRLVADDGLRERLADAALAECRRVYSWHAVGRQIMDIYAAVRNVPPPAGIDPHIPVEPCRFRAEPHLL
ncbi:glycosyltransferase involved in cell wall biosynthesis [Sphingomonas jejuensis]|uniref:Glycosyltransferase involved in cell wall biosynthesis n=1 Tax=Sphingomonas jejuensis TaxID=904715 RepID=A0ABX0XNA7_9SPHN|nr:glycosyltransferase family 4 protein [Sphingomonas jejuensis]NJC34688.1 glycosyltransferase involved in cell wall biosynthesis [Sphingomonas jejuensis]